MLDKPTLFRDADHGRGNAVPSGLRYACLSAVIEKSAETAGFLPYANQLLVTARMPITEAVG